MEEKKAVLAEEEEGQVAGGKEYPRIQPIPAKCPVCGSQNIKAGKRTEARFNFVLREFHCNDCGETWTVRIA